MSELGPGSLGLQDSRCHGEDNESEGLAFRV